LLRCYVVVTFPLLLFVYVERVTLLLRVTICCYVANYVALRLLRYLPHVTDLRWWIALVRYFDVVVGYTIYVTGYVVLVVTLRLITLRCC